MQHDLHVIRKIVPLGDSLFDSRHVSKVPLHMPRHHLILTHWPHLVLRRDSDGNSLSGSKIRQRYIHVVDANEAVVINFSGDGCSSDTHGVSPVPQGIFSFASEIHLMGGVGGTWFNLKRMQIENLADSPASLRCPKCRKGAKVGVAKEFLVCFRHINRSLQRVSFSFVPGLFEDDERLRDLSRSFAPSDQESEPK